MKKKNQQYRSKLVDIQSEIINDIKTILKEKFGGRVCLRHYHEWIDMDRWLAFEVDGAGYGRELFFDTVFMEGDTIGLYLHDTEDCYNPYWEAQDMTASDAVNLLTELEDVAEYIDKTGKEVVKDYDPDYDEDE